MKNIVIQDPYNPVKKWLLKRYACGHWYWSQEIAGRQIYPFKRTNRERIKRFIPQGSLYI